MAVRDPKLDALRLLASGVAHEFNNILTAAMGSISLAELEVEDLEDPKRLLHDAQQAVLRARDLTQRLIAFSSGGSGHRSLVDAAPFVREIAEACVAGSQAMLEFQAKPGLPKVVAEEGLLGDLVRDLVSSAVQTLTEPGVVRVALSEEEGSQDQDLGEGIWLRVDVDDEGPSLTETTRERLFDPYYADGRRGGGMALAVALAVARSHGGDIRAGDSPLGGARLSLLLPASKAAS